MSAAPGTVTDVFDRALPPVLTIRPGDTVVVGSLDASGYLARQRHPGDEPPQLISAPRGHCLTGPIAVEGAEPGLALAVRFVSLTPGDWGWTVAASRDNRLTRRLGVAEGPPSWLLWDIDAGKRQAVSNGYTVPVSAVPGRGGHAAGRVREAFDGPAARRGRRQHRLPRAGGRLGALSPGHRARGAAVPGRRARRPGRR